MNINDVRDAITRQIDSLFPDCEVYTEKVEQGLNGPTFFLKVVAVNSKKGIKGRLDYTITYDLLYYPVQDGNYNSECMSISQQLSQSFRYICTGAECLRVSDTSFEIVDDILHFTFNVSYSNVDVVEQTPMTLFEQEVINK